MILKDINGQDDIFDGAAAREIGEGDVEALDDGASTGEAGKLFEGFVEDVARIEIWNDENIGLASNEAFWGLFGGDFGIDGGV